MAGAECRATLTGSRAEPRFLPQNMAKPIEGVSFHPGAIKFYKEAGL
jgi:TRAP-type uncharacterized transport system substrate-binding protein